MLVISDAAADRCPPALSPVTPIRVGSPVFGGVFDDVGDAAEHVVDQIGHRVARGIAVGLAGPSVVHAGDDERAVPDELARQAAHDVFVVRGPAATVNDDDHGQVPRALRHEDVVLQRLDARLGIDDVVLDRDVLDDGLGNERRADALVLIDGHCELAGHALAVHLTEASGDGIPHGVEGVALFRRCGDLDH